MAIQRINKSSTTLLPLEPCAPVTLCLNSSWTDRTVSGLSTIRATVANVDRILGGGRAARGVGFSSRGEDVIQYSLDVDDSQFLTDGATGLPYALDCSNIAEINPYDCTVRSLESELVWSENLIPFPDDYDNAYWTKTNATVVPNVIPGLDGLTTVDFLKEDGTAAVQHNVFVNLLISVPVIAEYRLSLLIKPNGRDNLRLGLYPAGFTTYPTASFTLVGAGIAATGAAANNSEIFQLTDGWYLIRLYATPTATASNATLLLMLEDAASAITYNGDGVSGVYLGDVSLQYRL